MRGTIEARLLAKIDKRNLAGCWPFIGARTEKGYGKLSVGDGNWELAHRLAYGCFVGPIPNGKKVLHTCDNPPCCNDAHLYAGTSTDNAQDRERRGRHRPAWGEKHGRAKLSEIDVRTIRASNATCTKLAEIFSVHPSTIQRARKRVYWSNLDQ